MDVSNYWINRGDEYLLEHIKGKRYWRSRLRDQEKQLIKILKQISFNNVLEIGCGFGRITKIISDNFDFEKYFAIDISQSQIENAKIYVSNPKISFACGKIQDFSFDKQYDLVIASEVMMHINFEDILSVMRKITNTSKKYIITIDWNEFDKIGENKGGYCFMHDYEGIYKKLGINRVDSYNIPFSNYSNLIKIILKIKRKGIENQSIFLVEK